MSRDTSADALSSVAESVDKLRSIVLVMICERDAEGATCDEVEVALSMRHQTASARVNELMEAGKISDSGVRRRTRSGRKAIVWVAPCDGNVSLGSPLKWVGSKKWLAPRLRDLYAPHRGRRLVEPFVGGMNVALALRPADALLCDVNPHLINFYRRLRDSRPFEIEMRSDERLYYAYRDCFNQLTRSGAAETATAAELFYYLNKTGFNGVCRFNASGEFNVPFGKRKNVEYKRDFSEYATALRGWQLSCAPFGTQNLRADDFVYADPPYDGTFVDYSAGGFNWEQQRALAIWLSHHTGPVVASNSSSERVLDLYRGLGFDVQLAEAPRSVSCDGNRAPVMEMLAVKIC